MCVRGNSFSGKNKKVNKIQGDRNFCEGKTKQWELFKLWSEIKRCTNKYLCYKLSDLLSDTASNQKKGKSEKKGKVLGGFSHFSDILI